MEAIRVEQIIAENGRLVLEGLPVERGQSVEVIVLLDAPARVRTRLTVRELLESDAVGMWADRNDIGDTLDYASKLRESMQSRDWPDETTP